MTDFEQELEQNECGFAVKWARKEKIDSRKIMAIVLEGFKILDLQQKTGWLLGQCTILKSRFGNDAEQKRNYAQSLSYDGSPQLYLTIEAEPELIRLGMKVELNDSGDHLTMNEGGLMFVGSVPKDQGLLIPRQFVNCRLQVTRIGNITGSFKVVTVKKLEPAQVADGSKSRHADRDEPVSTASTSASLSKKSVATHTIPLNPIINATSAKGVSSLETLVCNSVCPTILSNDVVLVPKPKVHPSSKLGEDELDQFLRF